MFRALSYLNKILPFSKKVKHYTGYLLPVVELVSWLGFAIWCLHLIYDAEAYSIFIVLGVMFVLLLTPTWFLIRDFLYGLFLKVQRKIEPDSKIEIGETKGVIIKTDYFTFDILNNDGSITTIPYNRIRAEIIKKSVANIHLEKQVITFSLPTKQDINKVLPQLKTTLINSPWVASSQKPIINNIIKENDYSVVDVIVYTLKKEYAEKVIEYVKTNFIEKLV